MSRAPRPADRSAAPENVRRADGIERSSGPPDPDSLIPSQRARRQRIVDCAFELLTEREYEEIQVRDVAERAGVALGTVYRYFSSKEHLFADVLVKWSGAMRDRVERSPLQGDGPAEQLTDLYLRAIDAFARRPQFYRTLVVIDSTADPHARAVYRRFGTASSASFAAPLEGLDPDTAQAVAHTLLAVLNAVLRSWVTDSITIAEGRTRMTQAIELIFSAPPTQTSAKTKR